MKNKKFFQVLPLLLIFILWFIFSSPYFLNHKIPYPSSYQVSTFAPWSAYPIYHGPVKNAAMPDVISQIVPWRYLAISMWKQGQIPLWNPYSFSGTPLLANYQSAVLSPFNLLFFLFPFVDGWSLLVLLQPLLAGIFMYFYVRTLKVSDLSSLLSAISFMFCGFITTWMGYATLGYAILLLPLALFAIEKFYQIRKYRYLLLLSITIPLSFLSGHFQISVYFFLFVLCYLTFMFFTKGKKEALLLSIFSIIGIFFCLAQILPTLELYNQSLRSNLFQKLESIPWLYLPTFFAPDFFGNPVTRNDWFGHYAEWNGYIGAIPLLLALYSFKSIKNKYVLFFGISGIVALLLAFTSPLQDILVGLHIPVLSTSALSRIIVLFSFSFTVLSGFGLDFMLQDIRKKNAAPIFIWLGVLVLILSSLWVIVVAHLFIPVDKLAIAKSNLKLPSFLIIILGLTTICSLFIKHKKTLLIFSCLIILLSSFDMLRFTTKWQTFDSKNYFFPKTGVTTFLTSQNSNARVIGNIGGEMTNYYQLPGLEGYDALYIKRYGEFVSSLSDGIVKQADRSVVTMPKNGAYVPKAIQLLNVGYIVHKLSDDHAPWTFLFWTYPTGQFEKVYSDNAYEVYKNTTAFPKTFLVGKYTVVTDPQKEITTLFDNSFDRKHSVVLEQKPSLDIQNGTGQVSITSYLPTKITMTASTSKNSLLFLSDPYYPGWMALVDNNITPIYRADYAFRAIAIPKGVHQVVFLYQPLSFIVGVMFSMIGIIALILSGLLYRKKLFLSFGKSERK